MRLVFPLRPQDYSTKKSAFCDFHLFFLSLNLTRPLVSSNISVILKLFNPFIDQSVYQRLPWRGSPSPQRHYKERNWKSFNRIRKTASIWSNLVVPDGENDHIKTSQTGDLTAKGNHVKLTFKYFAVTVWTRSLLIRSVIIRRVKAHPSGARTKTTAKIYLSLPAWVLFDQGERCSVCSFYLYGTEGPCSPRWNTVIILKFSATFNQSCRATNHQSLSNAAWLITSTARDTQHCFHPVVLCVCEDAWNYLTLLSQICLKNNPEYS